MDRHPLTLAHSADADDVFMWWPLTGKLDPADPSRLLAPPVLDAGPLRFVGLPEDIQVLNRRAIARADLDITAVSYGTLPLVAGTYRPTTCGSSMGRGWGPKLVRRADRPQITLRALEAPLATGPFSIAVPGKNTSAFLVLSRLIDVARFRVVERPFDQITRAVAEGECDLGLLIHESQLTFEQAGLAAVCDLGVWFNERYGLPMPLGANVVRRDLDARFGPGSLARVAGLLHASIRHALSHREESLEYAARWSPLKDHASLNRYIDFYVNDLTLDCRPLGAKAVELMLGQPVDWLAP